ncbi:hypothetical protein M407DRAFT_242329 [Tulasnella calospora MUT 4182]|uniref:Uncharacterized protein n=1 Tax=Tulasnella calospora MUT 4182 TaxID=1051891 RepID=A0A0C3L8I7_9AGAM|nr:hypothetical protein M407DRAFT_242329 [Tulasnella calospora MUT 4182]
MSFTLRIARKTIPVSIARNVTRSVRISGSLQHSRSPAPVPQFRRHFASSGRVMLPNLVQGLTNAEHVRPPAERDTSHPHLFYHPLTAPSAAAFPPVFALSFLEKPLNPEFPRSRTILGWVGGEEEGMEDAGGGFQENPGFRELLHEAIADALTRPGFDEAIEADALQRGEGWLHITDNRNVPALNRIGDPDDIVGTVMVQDGKVIASTYQPMPSYRLCTADGPTRLPEGLAKKVLGYLEKEWEKEQKDSL